MSSCYILRGVENELLCFYHEKGVGGIRQRIYENGKWKKAAMLLSGGLENFTVTIDRDGKIYIFCQDGNGDVVVLTKTSGSGEDWSSRVVLKNQSEKIHTVCIHPILSGDGMSLVYNVPAQEDKSNYLVFQKLDESGRWSEASRIDKFLPLGDGLFEVQNVSDDHLLIFYQTRGAVENNIGYRELTPREIGRYNTFHTSGTYGVTETSYLTAQNGVHVAYCVRSMFSTQLIYRRKTDGAFGPPIFLGEAQKIENCVIHIIRDNLYVFYISNGQLFYCLSEDKGDSFSRAVKYKKKFCQQPVKASYVSYERQRENKIFLRQLYVDGLSPWDVQLIPDLDEDFYPEPTMPVAYATGEVTAKGDAPATEQVEEIVLRLKNKIDLLRAENTAKDERIVNLTNLLRIRNDEVVAADMLRRSLAEEKKRLEEEVARYSARRERPERGERLEPEAPPEREERLEPEGQPEQE